MAKVIRINRKLAVQKPPDLDDSESGELHLPVSVWLRLIKCYNLILRELRKSLERDANLTLPQFDVLVQLSRGVDRLSFVDLSRRLMVTSGNLTGIVDRLEREGLVYREPDVTDRRVVHIRLTPDGKSAINRTIPEHVREIESIFRGLPAKDLKQLRDLLEKLKDHLSKRGK